jgi:uncharacterized protein YraI
MQSKLLSSLAAATLLGSVGAAAAATRPVASDTNLYYGPGKKWGVIAQIPAQAHVTVINCGPGWKRDWCHVRYGKKKGYVAAATLAPSASGRSVMVAPLVTTDITNLRSGPGAKWQVIATIPPETSVNVSSCFSGWMGKWCKVTYADKTGFVNRALLKRAGALFAQ